MRKYLETLFNHWRALVAPVLIALVVAVGYVMVQPRTYQASANVWFQSTSITDEASGNGQANQGNQANAFLTPSEVAVGVFNELLKTRDFCVAVAHRSSLARYLSEPGHAPASDPVSSLTGLLHGGGSSGQPSGQVLDNAIQAVMQKQIVFIASGPQIVNMTFTLGDPQVAASTLNALIAEFQDQVVTVQRVTNQEQLNLIKQQVADQQQQVTNADAAVARYLAQHAELRVGQPPPDATFSGLQQVANEAHQQYANLVQSQNQVQLQQVQLNQGKLTQFRVIDPPVVPYQPSSRLKTIVTGVGGGLAVGLVVALIALVALVFADQTLRTPDDVERSLGLKVVGVIPFRPSDPGPRPDRPPDPPRGGRSRAGSAA